MVSKSYTRDIYDPERRKRYLENYERIFRKKSKIKGKKNGNTR